jgi:hypothetical protein
MDLYAHLQNLNPEGPGGAQLKPPHQHQHQHQHHDQHQQQQRNYGGSGAWPFHSQPLRGTYYGPEIPDDTPPGHQRQQIQAMNQTGQHASRSEQPTDRFQNMPAAPSNNQGSHQGIPLSSGYQVYRQTPSHSPYMQPPPSLHVQPPISPYMQCTSSPYMYLPLNPYLQDPPSPYIQIAQRLPGPSTSGGNLQEAVAGQGIAQKQSAHKPAQPTPPVPPTAISPYGNRIQDLFRFSIDAYNYVMTGNLPFNARDDFQEPGDLNPEDVHARLTHAVNDSVQAQKINRDLANHVRELYGFHTWETQNSGTKGVAERTHHQDDTTEQDNERSRPVPRRARLHPAVTREFEEALPPPRPRRRLPPAATREFEMMAAGPDSDEGE